MTATVLYSIMTECGAVMTGSHDLNIMNGRIMRSALE